MPEPIIYLLFKKMFSWFCELRSSSNAFDSFKIVSIFFNCEIMDRTFFCEYLSRFWSKAEGRKGQFKSLAARQESS